LDNNVGPSVESISNRGHTLLLKTAKFGDISFYQKTSQIFGDTAVPPHLFIVRLVLS